MISVGQGGVAFACAAVKSIAPARAQIHRISLAARRQAGAHRFSPTFSTDGRLSAEDFDECSCRADGLRISAALPASDEPAALTGVITRHHYCAVRVALMEARAYLLRHARQATWH